jgi:hypothetical protein
MVSAFLPADQGYALMKAAASVMALHGECNQRKRRESAGNLEPLLHLPPQSEAAMNGDMLNQAVLADPTGTIFSVPERLLIPPRSYGEDGLGSGLVPRETFRPSSQPSFSENTTFFGEKNASRYSGLDLRKIVVAAYAEGRVTDSADAFGGEMPS